MKVRFFKLSILFLLGAVAACCFYSCNSKNSTSNAAQPTIVSMTPSQVGAGQQNVNGAITGTNFTGAVTVSLGSDIVVNQFTVVNANQLTVVFSVSSSATQGSRTITVTAGGGTASESGLLFVTAPVPVAKFTVNPPQGEVHTLFTFDGSSSTSAGSPIADYKWNFGDGKKDNGKKVTHQYAKPDNYDVSLTVVNGNHQSDKADKALKVTKPQTVYCSGACSGYPNAQYFHVAAVMKDSSTLVTVTADKDICFCKAGCGEGRRVHPNSMGEFLGDIDSMSGRNVTFDHHLLPEYTAPKVGEYVLIVFKPCR